MVVRLYSLLVEFRRRKTLPQLAAVFWISVGAPILALASSPLPPKAGDYLETGYVTTLKQTRSPLIAGQEDARLGVPQVVSVMPFPGGLQLNLSFNWHEGDWLFRIKDDGTFERNTDWGDSEGTQLNIVDPEHFSLNAPRGPVRSYTFVEDADRFIAQQVLVGKYLDPVGHAYEFGTDGIAHFPERTFEYSIGLDQIFDPYDFFRVGQTNEFIAFRWENSELVLFLVHGSEGPGYGDADFTQPIVHLHPAVLAPAR